MRYEIKTSKGFLIIEDIHPDLRVYYVEGDDLSALNKDKTLLKNLGDVDRSEIRRLGKSV